MLTNPRPNIATGLLWLAIIAAFLAVQHLDMTEEPEAVTAVLTEAQKQARKEAAAQYACGHQAHYEWVNATTIECFTKRGKPAGTTLVAGGQQ